LSYEERETALFELLLENVIGLKRRLRKKLETGIRRTRVLMSNSWFDGKVGEENVGGHNGIVFEIGYRRQANCLPIS
jgi:hypothetical protein